MTKEQLTLISYLEDKVFYAPPKPDNFEFWGLFFSGRRVSVCGKSVWKKRGHVISAIKDKLSIWGNEGFTRETVNTLIESGIIDIRRVN